MHTYRKNIYFVRFQFDLVCDNEYKLAFVGVVNNFSRFVFMPIAGVLSDRCVPKSSHLPITFVSMIIIIQFQIRSLTYANHWDDSLGFVRHSTIIFGVIQHVPRDGVRDS